MSFETFGLAFRAINLHLAKAMVNNLTGAGAQDSSGQFVTIEGAIVIVSMSPIIWTSTIA